MVTVPDRGADARAVGYAEDDEKVVPVVNFANAEETVGEVTLDNRYRAAEFVHIRSWLTTRVAMCTAECLALRFAMTLCMLLAHT